MSCACRAPGCNHAAAYQGGLCNSHGSREKRHGHWSQQPLATPTVNEFRKRVRARLDKDPAGTAWSILEERWAALVTWSEQVMDEWYAGRPSQQHRRGAAESFLKVAAEASARDVIETALSVYLIGMHVDPRFFRTDQAFRRQLVRAVRKLSALNAGVWNGKRAYRELPPRTAEIMAVGLSEAFSAAAANVVWLEQQEDERKRHELQSLRSAIAACAEPVVEAPDATPSGTEPSQQAAASPPAVSVTNFGDRRVDRRVLPDGTVMETASIRVRAGPQAA